MTVRAFLLVTGAAVVASFFLVWLYAPTDAIMGAGQKILYIHLPAAFAMFAASFAVFVGSIGYIWTRRGRWDALAAAGARATLLFSAIVLLTGVFWARLAWGYWWAWSPRLTFTLVLFLLYVAYMVLRLRIRPRPKKTITCAVYGAVAFLDVPLVYLSVRMLPDVHPTSATLTGAMLATLAVCCTAAMLLFVGFIGKPVMRALRWPVRTHHPGTGSGCRPTHA